MTDTTVPAGAGDITPADAFDAWWPTHAVRHNSRSPVAAREAFYAGYEAGAARAAADQLERIRQILDPGKIEWLIHTLDLIDKLAKSRGMETSTEAQDDLRKLADLLAAQDTPPTTTEETR